VREEWDRVSSFRHSAVTTRQRTHETNALHIAGWIECEKEDSASGAIIWNCRIVILADDENVVLGVLVWKERLFSASVSNTGTTKVTASVERTCMDCV
jgi:hypothetical protein